MSERARYAIYFVPAAQSDLYRFGSAVLGYDCYSGATLAYPAELAHDAQSWCTLVEEPRRYGFHSTLKAPFHLSPACCETQLVDAVQELAASAHAIPAIAPVVQILGGFIAVLSQQPEPSLDALAARCTTELDCFRAPILQQERARRLATGLDPAQIENLDRWGYPYVFAHFRFHMTLTGRIAADAQKSTLALLQRGFERRCGYGIVAIDRVALLKQDDPQAAFRVLTQAPLRAAR
jgi:putative phosphonate metabolism protein